MDDNIRSPAQTTLELHLASIRFACGVDAGKWALLKYAWPHIYVRVVGRDLDSGHTFAHDFHLQCEGYPDPGPLVERWQFADNETNGTRPSSPSSGSPGYIDALKEWGEGIYRAWNRGAATHNDWAIKRPDEAWNRNRDISFIMEQLYALTSEQAVWLAYQR